MSDDTKGGTERSREAKYTLSLKDKQDWLVVRFEDKQDLLQVGEDLGVNLEGMTVTQACKALQDAYGNTKAPSQAPQTIASTKKAAKKAQSASKASKKAEPPKAKEETPKPVLKAVEDDTLTSAAKSDVKEDEPAEPASDDLAAALQELKADVEAGKLNRADVRTFARNNSADMTKAQMQELREIIKGAQA